MGSIKKLISCINHIRKDRGYDSPIALTGPEQVGKSTLSIQILKKMYYDGGPIEEFLEKYLSYTNADLEPKLTAAEPESAIIADETIRWAWRRLWATTESKAAGMLWRQIGYKRLLAFFNLPCFWDLDNIYRNTRVKLWIHVFQKGHAAIFQPNVHAFGIDPWYQKDVLKDMGFVSQFDDWEKTLRHYMKCKVFFGAVDFDPLPDEWQKTYSRISEERKLTQEETEPHKALAERNMLAQLLHKDGHTYKSMSELTGRPLQTVAYWVRKGENEIT